MGDYISGLKYDVKLDRPLLHSCKWMCNNMGWNYDEWRFVHVDGVAVADEDTARSMNMTAYSTVTLYCEPKAT